MAWISGSQGSNYAELTGLSAASGTLMFHAASSAPTSRGCYAQMELSGANLQVYFWSNGSNTYNGHDQSYDGSTTNVSSTWQPFVVTINGSGQVNWYYWNGSAFATFTTQYGYGAAQTVTAVRIGRKDEDLYSTDDYAPNGLKVAYFRFWPGVVLTTGEMATERTAATAQTSGCTINVPCISNLNDDSGNSNHLTGGGSYSVDTEVPDYVTGGGAASAPKRSLLLGIG